MVDQGAIVKVALVLGLRIILQLNYSTGSVGMLSTWNTRNRKRSANGQQSLNDLHLKRTPPGMTLLTWQKVLMDLNLTTEVTCTNRSRVANQVVRRMESPRVMITVSSRWGDLHAALLSLGDYPKITVVDVGIHDVPDELVQCFSQVEWLVAPHPFYLSSAWNAAIRKHLADEVSWIICNDDVLFPHDWQRRFEIAQQTFPQAVWMGLTQSIQFSGFWLPTRTWKIVGPFDEAFSTYYEDDDYWLRIEACFGAKSKLRQQIFPQLQPVVIHRRTGWFWNWGQGLRMLLNKRKSRAMFFRKWPVAQGVQECGKKHCCLTTRANIQVLGLEGHAPNVCKQSCRYVVGM